jgi:two-component system cell cycle response regulator
LAFFDAKLSVRRLEELHKKFLFYLELSLGEDSKKNRICTSKFLIEYIASSYVDIFNPTLKLVFDVEDTQLAVNPAHFQYMFSELLDRYLKDYRASKPINIHGKIIDDSFHLWFDNLGISHSVDRDSRLSELVQFNSNTNGDSDSEIGLKIVKKIVDIYDGILLMSSVNRDEMAIYVTLPLAMSNQGSIALVNV